MRRKGTGEPTAGKSSTVGSVGGRRKRACSAGTSLAAYPTACPVRDGGPGKRNGSNAVTAPWADRTWSLPVEAGAVHYLDAMHWKHAVPLMNRSP